MSNPNFEAWQKSIPGSSCFFASQLLNHQYAERKDSLFPQTLAPDLSVSRGFFSF
jgi:hypothetical protein